MKGYKMPLVPNYTIFYPVCSRGRRGTKTKGLLTKTGNMGTPTLQIIPASQRSPNYLLRELHLQAPKAMAASILQFSPFWGNKGQLTCSVHIFGLLLLSHSSLYIRTKWWNGLSLWGHGGTWTITRCCCSILSLAGKLQADDLSMLPTAACGWAGHLLYLFLFTLLQNLSCFGIEREGDTNYNLMEFYVLWWEDLTVGRQHGPLHWMTGKVFLSSCEVGLSPCVNHDYC